jgi:ribokinase
MGASVRMIGRVGDDTFGPALLDALRSDGIDVQGVALDSANSSGIALIMVDSNAQNEIVVIPGANHACDVTQLEAAKRAIDDADALMLQLEVPLDLLIEAAQYAKSRGLAVVWDPAPAMELPYEVYAVANVLTPNQAEAEALTGVTVSDADSAARAARILRDRGVHTAVVKLGDLGLYYESPDDSGFIPAYKVDVVDTVAAGDAFAGSLAVALAEGKPLPEALRYGAAAGALAVTKSGAQPAMPRREDVEALLSRSGEMSQGD